MKTLFLWGILLSAASTMLAAEFDLRYSFQSSGAAAMFPFFGSLQQMRFAQKDGLRFIEVGDIVQIDNFKLRTTLNCSHRQRSCVLKRGTSHVAANASPAPDGKWEKTSEQRFGLPVEKFSFSAQVPLGEKIFSEIWLVPGRDRWNSVAQAFQVIQGIPAIDNSLFLAPPGYVPIRYRLSVQGRKEVGELKAELAEFKLSNVPVALFQVPTGYATNQLQARPIKPKAKK